VIVQNPTGNLLPIGIIFMAVLALPGVVCGYVGAGLRPIFDRRSRGDSQAVRYR
jgi:hypothetical protein